MVIPGATPAPDASSSLTYEPYYGLTEKPFSLSANPKFLYRSPAHDAAFEMLLAGIRRREGLIVLSGEVGTGKTTLCRAVLDALDVRTFSSFVPDPFVTREELLKTLLIDFGVMSVDDVRAGRLRGASRQDLSYLLYEFLGTLATLRAVAVLVIDEAQHLSLPVLEEIRILSEMESREKLLQVVLVGQPELKAQLSQPSMRQVNQRVSVRCELQPLDADGVAAYVAHRLQVAGPLTCPEVFTSAAIGAVHLASAGVPRLINKICDRALHCGHLLASEVIDETTVRRALDQLDLPDVATMADSGATANPDADREPSARPAAVPAAAAAAPAAPGPAPNGRTAAVALAPLPDAWNAALAATEVTGHLDDFLSEETPAAPSRSGRLVGWSQPPFGVTAEETDTPPKPTLLDRLRRLAG